ncbi:hypothetical protein FM106_30025 [Brachybacterium faecium]|nr:hypothetical protein FM106_30025 [Brachybacterium faecium]
MRPGTGLGRGEGDVAHVAGGGRTAAGRAGEGRRRLRVDQSAGQPRPRSRGSGAEESPGSIRHGGG